MPPVAEGGLEAGVRRLLSTAGNVAKRRRRRKLPGPCCWDMIGRLAGACCGTGRPGHGLPGVSARNPRGRILHRHGGERARSGHRGGSAGRTGVRPDSCTVRASRRRQTASCEIDRTRARRAGREPVRLGGSDYEVRWAALEGTERGAIALPVDGVRFPIRVRAPQPGDRIRTRAGSRKVAKLLMERRVPASDRSAVPVVVDADRRVLWVAGHSRAAVEPSDPGGAWFAIGFTERRDLHDERPRSVSSRRTPAASPSSTSSTPHRRSRTASPAWARISPPHTRGTPMSCCWACSRDRSCSSATWFARSGVRCRSTSSSRRAMARARRVRATVELLYDPRAPMAGRHIIIVEDIVDSGTTLNQLCGGIAERGPASLEICALLHKRIAPDLEWEPRWVGFDAPNEFLVGYGLDHGGGFSSPSVHRVLFVRESYARGAAGETAKPEQAGIDKNETRPAAEAGRQRFLGAHASMAQDGVVLGAADSDPRRPPPVHGRRQGEPGDAELYAVP